MISKFAVKIISKMRRLAPILLIPMVMLHLAWITPLVEWSCFCPDDKPNHRCCCNCPKCTKNRGGFKSFCHLNPIKVDGFGIPKASSKIALFSNEHIALEPESVNDHSALSGCQCDSHIKKISIDFNPFLPQAISIRARLFPVVRIVTTDDCRPPEAIPCQPHPPG